MIRRFLLSRERDVSGVSGTGLVAEGAQFWDGTVAVRWRSLTASTTFYASVDDVLHIHGHGGATVLKWLDFPGQTWCKNEHSEATV